MSARYRERSPSMTRGVRRASAYDWQVFNAYMADEEATVESVARAFGRSECFVEDAIERVRFEQSKVALELSASRSR